jgi:hypothetical protein
MCDGERGIEHGRASAQLERLVELLAEGCEVATDRADRVEVRQASVGKCALGSTQERFAKEVGAPS